MPKRVFSDEEKKLAITTALMGSKDGIRPSFYKGAMAIKTDPRTVKRIFSTNQGLVESITKEVAVVRNNVDSETLTLLKDNALACLRETARRLQDPDFLKTMKQFDLNGTMISSIDKARLLENKSTSNSGFAGELIIRWKDETGGKRDRN